MALFGAAFGAPNQCITILYRIRPPLTEFFKFLQKISSFNCLMPWSNFPVVFNEFNFQGFFKEALFIHVFFLAYANLDNY